ncbi:MAG TPA: hypothetical protein VGW39_13845 [Chthoniobacterales bacterium]|nr:hypothetical protein [Chthoniobacterales bacterium]
MRIPLPSRSRPPNAGKANEGKLAANFGFTPSELRALRALKTPAGIQRYLDEIPYHLAGTAWSPRVVLREKTAHCLEGATFAAAALRVIGYSPLLLDLEADQDTDHVLAVFKSRGHWGAIAKSNFAGCRYREPVYRTLRELALSYFNVYFNLRGERTLRRYSRPVNLAQFDHRHWMTSEKNIWFIAEHLCDVPHTPLLKPGLEKLLTRIDARTMRSEMVGHRRK